MSLIRFCILSHYALPIWHIKIVSRFSIQKLLCRTDIDLNITRTIEFAYLVCFKSVDMQYIVSKNIFDMISMHSLMFVMQNVCNVKTFTKFLLFDRKWMWYKSIISRYISIPLLRKIFVHIHHIVRISAF